MKRGQFGTRTIWHRSEKGTIWHRDVIRIRNAISRLERNTLSNGREILCQIFGNPHFKSTPGREKTSSFALFTQWQNIFPNPAPEGRTDTLQLSYLPQMLAEYIQYKYIYPTDTCFLTQRPKGAQTPSNCNIFPKCWQKISNTNISIQLTHL